MNTIFLSQRGNYKNLIVYQKSVMIYDITYYFAHHFLSKSDRTIDQMIQAARSGKQNIAEGNQAAATSLETEIKLTNVAKASLEELLIDYTDYLRVHNKTIWTDTHPRYEKTRFQNCDDWKTMQPVKKYTHNTPPYYINVQMKSLPSFV